MSDRWSTNLLSLFMLALMVAVIGCGSEDSQPSSGGSAGSETGGAGGTGGTGGATNGEEAGTGGVDGGTDGDAGTGAEAGNAGTGGSVSDAGPAETNLQSTVTHDGVTVELAAPALVGFFIDGYPFVVGSTVVTGYTPAPATLPSGRIINGCMKNPPMRKGEAGFDSAAGDHYVDALNDANNLPLTLDPGDSLLIAVSDEEKNTVKSHLSHVALLTVVDAVPPADAFRPAYAASSFKTMFTYSQVDTAKLASLEVVGSPPGWDEMEGRLRRFTQDLAPNWNRDYLEAGGHGPLYGRDLCKYEGRPYVMVNSDYPVDQKKQTLIGLIQRGIDRYGLFLSAKESGIGHPWAPDGGHNSGRKFSILFAGALLGDLDMTEVWKQTGRLTDPNTQGQFQEDAMVFSVEQVHVDATNSAEWSPPYDDKPHQPYSQSMIGMPDWRGRADDPNKTDASWVGHPYRLSPNNGSQHGQALSLLVMGLEPSWANDAYLDYHTRFMEIMSMRPDPWGTERGAALSYDPVVGSQPEGGWDNWQKNWNDVWVWEMAQHHWYAFYSFPW